VSIGCLIDGQQEKQKRTCAGDANWLFDRLATRKTKKNLCRRCQLVIWLIGSKKRTCTRGANQSFGNKKNKEKLHKRCQLVVRLIGSKKQKRTCAGGAHWLFNWLATRKTKKEPAQEVPIGHLINWQQKAIWSFHQCPKKCARSANWSNDQLATKNQKEAA